MNNVAPEIPSFLIRQPKGEPTMTAHVPPPAELKNADKSTAVPATKKKRSDCYCATVKIKIPLDMSNAESLALAIKAVEGIKTAMPTGTSVDIAASLGKV